VETAIRCCDGYGIFQLYQKLNNVTIKDLKKLGFDIRKKPGMVFVIKRDKLQVEIKKITDTKFSYKENEPTSHIPVLLDQIKNTI